MTVLTKTPGIFLVPLVGLFAMIETVKYGRNAGQDPMAPPHRHQDTRRAAAPLLAWAAIMLVVYVALAGLWVAPYTLAEVMDISGDYAEQGHSTPSSMPVASSTAIPEPGSTRSTTCGAPAHRPGLLLVPALFRRNAATAAAAFSMALSWRCQAFFFIVAMNWPRNSTAPCHLHAA